LVGRGDGDRSTDRVGWTELADFRQHQAAARLKHGRVIEKSGSPLQNATFRRVWIGATVSAAGDAASWVALVAYALGLAHGSVATLAVLYTAPVAVGRLVAGWALDRHDRRWLLVGDSLVRAAVFGTIPLAAAWGGLTDAFPAADRSLRAAARAHGLPADPAGLTQRGERWRPWRGYGAHLLWRARSIQAAEWPPGGQRPRAPGRVGE
jgi:hypothetical protein